MEENTLEKMVAIYCKKHHGKAICPQCQALLDYAVERDRRCPRKEEKSFCASCPHPCYAPKMREKIREVMKFSGPRMLIYEPKLALAHVRDTIVKRRKRT